MLFSVLPPGLNCILWPIDSVVARMSARVQQNVCDCSTKTRDNVFVTVQVRLSSQPSLLVSSKWKPSPLPHPIPPSPQVIVQYQVIPQKAYEAYYKLSDPHLQIKS